MFYLPETQTTLYTVQLCWSRQSTARSVAASWIVTVSSLALGLGNQCHLWLWYMFNYWI